VSRALDILATLRLEDGREWGDAATAIQLEDARAVLGGEQPYNFLTRSRGFSKTTDLAGVAIAWLLTFPTGARLYWLAADQDQGRLAVDAINGFATRTDLLHGALDIQASRVVATATSSRLDVLPADAPSAWGLTPHALIADELANWHDGPAARRLWEATSTAVAKRDNAKLVVLTTPSYPHHFAAEILDHARSSPMWRVHEVTGPPPWMDGDRLEEQRSRLPESVFAQLFEGLWTEAEGAFLSPAALDECFALAGPQPPDVHRNPRYVAGLDLGHVNDRTALAVAHRDGPHVVLDYMRTWEGSRRHPVNFDDVENAIASLYGDYKFSLRADPWQGLHLLQHLRDRGVRAKEFQFTPSSKQRLASTLLQSVNDRQLKLYPVDGLREELLGLRVKQTSGGWTFDHDAGGHDDRAVALSLAIVAAWETSGHTGPRRLAKAGGRSAFAASSDLAGERWRRESSLDLDVRQERRRRRRQQREEQKYEEALERRIDAIIARSQAKDEEE
jgi:hypothetical protein